MFVSKATAKAVKKFDDDYNKLTPAQKRARKKAADVANALFKKKNKKRDDRLRKQQAAARKRFNALKSAKDINRRSTYRKIK